MQVEIPTASINDLRFAPVKLSSGRMLTHRPAANGSQDVMEGDRLAELDNKEAAEYQSIMAGRATR